MARSHMLYDIIGLIDDKAITMDDLNEFSDDFKEEVLRILNHKPIYYEEDD